MTRQEALELVGSVYQEWGYRADGQREGGPAAPVERDVGLRLVGFRQPSALKKPSAESADMVDSPSTK